MSIDLLPLKTLGSMTTSEKRAFKEIRNQWIADQFRGTKPEDANEKFEEIASKLGRISAQRVKQILVGLGLVDKRKHDDARRKRDEIVAQVRDADPSTRERLAYELSLKAKVSLGTIKGWCHTAGVRVGKAPSGNVDKWLKVIGLYRQHRNMATVARLVGVSREAIGKYVERAKLYGVLEVADGALRHDPVVRKHLKAIDAANEAITARLVEIGKEKAKGNQ